MQPAPGPEPGWWRGSVWEEVQAAGLFDEAWYTTAYRDVAEAGVDPLWHYVTQGADQGRDPNPLFDTKWYRTAYPDIAATSLVPLLHYFSFGAAEGRNPGPGFDTAWYLRTNPDVRVAGVNPLGHYLTAGEAEGRRPLPLPGSRSAGVARGPSVVYVSGEPASPGHQYRVERHAEAVRRLGGHAEVLTLPAAASNQLAQLDAADVVVLWRAAWSHEVEKVVDRARRGGAVLLFDVDDLMVDPEVATVATVDGIRSQGLTRDEVRAWFGKVRRTAEACDACTATTEELAARLRLLGMPTYVLPNGFDDATLRHSRLAVRTRRQLPHDGLCRIGYAAGSRTHQRDFLVVAGAVAQVLRENPQARLVLYRSALDLDEFPDFDGLRAQVEWRTLVPLDRLPYELARLDVNLAPLEVGNPFCEAKSPLKLFEAALVDVPTVASPTEPFRSVVEQGVDGILATTHDEWLDALRQLVTDPEVRRRLGQTARRRMLWRHGPERRAQAVKAVLDQLLDDGAAAADAFALEVARARRPPPEPPALGDGEVVYEHDRLGEAQVTVVVPVHNYAEPLVDALASVRAQTVAALDLVVVDDASSDDSLAVAHAWLQEHADRFNRVVLLAHRDNAGLARARNSGVDIADTPFVLPLDADNALLPDCCEQLLDALDGSAAAFAYPRIRHFGEDSELFPPDHVRGYLPYVPQRLVASNYIDAMALVRKGAWAAAGGYREGLSGWEDYDLWCRLAELGLHGTQVAEDLALYRVHRRSMLHTVTHRGDRLATVHEAISAAHPWLRLEDRDPAPSTGTTDIVVAHETAAAWRPATAEDHRRLVWGGDVAATDATGFADHTADARGTARTAAGGELGERARRLLPLLRCPETGEPLEPAADGGLRTTRSGRRWPVVDGRPVLFPGMTEPARAEPGHAGNPLPERARHVVDSTAGPVLHLSGGGTAAAPDRDDVVELDAALFDPTDVVGDAHRLPLASGAFDLVVAMNAFEHYRDPSRVVAELHRVLRPGGLVFVHTAFLQPLHEEPHHYFNVTRFGLDQWFAPFETVDLRVSDNFHPGYALAWLASDVEEVLADDVARDAATAFRATTLGTFADYWRDPATREHDPRWEAFAKLTPDSLQRVAAGFEYLGRRP